MRFRFVLWTYNTKAFVLVALILFLLAACNTDATPTATQPPTPVPTDTAPGYSANNPITANDDWTPVIETFDGMDMVLVPAGCYEMGSTDGNPDETPVHEQCIDSPFWIGRFEVTNAQYRQCVDAGDCTESAYASEERSNAPEQAVMGVNWSQAQVYAAWMGMRLPTEAEWEYAARGPDGLTSPWGENDPTCEQLNFRDDDGFCVGSITEGGRYSPQGDSWVGAADMAGNVWEWTSSQYQAYPYSPTDGREDTTGSTLQRVLRGACYGSNASFIRATFRHEQNPRTQSNTWGFRVVYEGDVPE